VAAVALILGAACVVHVPQGSVAVLSWRGGGTPTLLGAGFYLRLPFLQTIQRYPGGLVVVEGEAAASSREGSGLTIPFRARAHPSDQQLLALHQAGRAGGADRVLRAMVEDQIRKAAAFVGTFDLASGAAKDAIQREAASALEGRFGPGLSLELSPARLPPEVRASFQREAIYGKRRETGARVVLVGLDGADWDVIDPMIARGELPHLALLKKEGAWSRMRSNVPTLSPLLWTTVATGKAPDRHGINDFLVLDPRTGRQVPINSTFRRAKALWTILSEAGLQNDTIAWWATWPVEAVEGHLISDRVAYSTFNVARVEEGRGAVHPPEYAAAVARLRVSEETIPYRQVARFVHIGQEEFGRARAAVTHGKETEAQESINVLVRVLASTETYRRVALDLLDSRARSGTPARLFAVYFQGVDEINHRFAHCAPPRAPLCSEADYPRFGDAVSAFYRYQDGILGEILERVRGATVIVLSDHGFKSGDGRPRDVKPFIQDKPGMWHDLAGIFVASGPPIRRGEIPFCTLYDIAPTVLYLLGLPLPEDMPGRVLEAAVTESFKSQVPMVKVPSYEGLAGTAPADTTSGPLAAGGGASGHGGEAISGEADAEMVEQLRSLGYVGGGERGGAAGSAQAPVATGSQGAGSAGPGPRGPASREESRAGAAVPTLLYHTNLGTVYLGKKQYDKAEAEFRQALQIDPTSSQALTDLAILHEMKGEPEKALQVLESLERLDTPGEPGPLMKMADLFIRLGRTADGIDFMRRIEGRRASGDEREVPLRVALGMLQAAAERPAEAEKELLRALGIDPASISAMQELFPLYDRQGRARDLEPRIRAVLVRAPRSAMHHNWLGLVLRRRGDLKGAEAEFRKTLDLSPGMAGAMANLGSLYMQEGRAGEAVAVLKEALEKDPQSVESRTNLIVALGMTQDLAGARRRVEEVESEGRKVPLYYNALAYALYLNGRSEEALATLRESLRLDPRQPDALRLRAEIERGQPAAGSPYR